MLGRVVCHIRCARDGSTMVKESRHQIGVELAPNLWYDDDTNPINALAIRLATAAVRHPLQGSIVANE